MGLPVKVAPARQATIRMLCRGGRPSPRSQRGGQRAPRVAGGEQQPTTAHPVHIVVATGNPNADPLTQMGKPRPRRLSA